MFRMQFEEVKEKPIYLVALYRIDMDKMKRHLNWKRKEASESDRWVTSLLRFIGYDLRTSC